MTTPKRQSLIERIEWQGKVLAMLVRRDFGEEGANFVTPDEYPMQLGVISHPSGAVVKPHIHNASTKVVESVQEVLHLQRGKVEIQFFTPDGQSIDQVVLGAGDTILLVSGGHGLLFLEDSKLIEVKQGPYLGHEDDKRLLNLAQEPKP